MSNSINSYDAIESLIQEEGLQIVLIHIHPELDMMLVVLNTKAVLHQRISAYSRLRTSDPSALLKYELIGSGTGIH